MWNLVSWMPRKNAKDRMILEIVKCCVKNGINLNFSKGERVRGPDEDEGTLGTHGYFCHEDKTLAVGAGNRGWFLILLHEYCHLQQYLEGAKWFDDEYINSLDDSFWDWLAGDVELDKQKLIELATCYIECEADCERRTVELIRKNKGLNINAQRYTRGANSYLMFYGALLTTRKWYTKESPASSSRLFNMMPANRFITTEEALNPTEKYMKILMEECY